MHREGWKENESIVGIIEENEAGGDLKENMLIPKAPHGILAGILDCSKLLSKNWSSTTSSLENHKQTTLQQLQSITLHNPHLLGIHHHRRYRNYVTLWIRCSSTAIFGREDRSSRARDGSSNRHVQQVRSGSVFILLVPPPFSFDPLSPYES